MTANEHTRAYKHQWYMAHREITLERSRMQRLSDPEGYAVYQRAYRNANIEELRAASRNWKAENAERHRVSSRQYGQDHKEEISAKRKEGRRILKQTVLDAYGGRCACCGESAFEFLTLDHINGDGATHRRGLGIDKGRSNRLYKTLIAEGFPPGLRVLCFNCNSSRGFYGYCPHQPDDKVTPNRGEHPKAPV